MFRVSSSMDGPSKAKLAATKRDFNACKHNERDDQNKTKPIALFLSKQQKHTKRTRIQVPWPELIRTTSVRRRRSSLSIRIAQSTKCNCFAALKREAIIRLLFWRLSSASTREFAKPSSMAMMISMMMDDDDRTNAGFSKCHVCGSTVVDRWSSALRPKRSVF